MKKLQSLIVVISSNTQVVKSLGVAATLLLLLLGASSSYFQNAEPKPPAAAAPNNKRVGNGIVRTATKAAPVFAYWIYGGDGERIVRVLKATYHPRNQYLLLLDAADERADLALYLQSHPVFSAFDNVNVVGRTYAVNQMGGSGLAAFLHASALLLKLTSSWDWFIPLNTASDYPLITQDDILHAFKFLPRDLNFVHFANNTSSSSSSSDDKVKQVVVDPSIYDRKSSPIFYAKETRNVPNTFKILAGSPWMILSRSLLEFCVKGWDNFPRKLLMYMSNLASPLEFYFQTVICNSPSFRNTTINIDLRYVMLSGNDSLSQMEGMLIVARHFNDDTTVLLQEIDSKVLNRSADGVVPGKWSSEEKGNVTDERKDEWKWGDINLVEASPRGDKLQLRLSQLAKERLDGCPNPSRMLKR